MNILHIDSCALGDHSASRQHTAAIITQLTINHPQATFLYRDLAAAPLSHASGPLLQVLSQRWDANIPMSTELSAEAMQSASLLEEFKDADLVLIGAPMHNFSVPSTLKAWLDRLLELKACTKNQPEKRVMLVTSGCTSASDAEMEQLLTNYEILLKSVFKTMGVVQLDMMRGIADFPRVTGLKTAA